MAYTSGNRRFTRSPLVLPVLCTADPATRVGSQAGWTRNLSPTGGCLVLPERLPLAQPLQLGFQTAGGLLEAEARVVWVGHPDCDLRGHGVFFTRMAPAPRRVLLELLCTQGLVRPAGLRLAVSLPVTCQGQGQPPLRGWTSNLSRGGLALALPQRLPGGTAVVLTLHAPPDALTLAGTVVWGEGEPGRSPGEAIRHGVRFPVLDPVSDLALARLVTRLPRPPRPAQHAPREAEAVPPR